MRKRCPICKNMIRLRNSGAFYNHTTTANSGLRLRAVTALTKCPGSRLSFELAKAIADDRAERTDLHKGSVV